MGNEKAVRKVAMSRQRWCNLYNLIIGAVGTSAAIERRIQAAEVKVAEVTGATISVETGALTFPTEDFYETVEANLTDLEVFGCKVALVQAICGDGRTRPRASLGRIKRYLLPLASELGIARLVQKESALADENAEKLDLSFDDEPEKVDTKGLETPEGRELK